MEWLNYHHLYYFWIVAKEETITRASQKLRLSQPTISAQIQSLEKSLNEKLFDRVGKRLSLSEQGRVVFRFADEIFTTGQELMNTLKNQSTQRAQRLQIGVSDVVPKLIVHRLVQPALDEIQNLEIHFQEAKTEQLLFELSQHHLDLVITDTKSSLILGTHFHDHLLGQSGISFFASQKLIKQYPQRFPKCLHHAPLLLPSKHSSFRREVEQWLVHKKIQPRLVGEFEDSALMKVFGQFSNGFFCAPAVLTKDIESQYQVKAVGRAPKIKEKFYAISAERKIIHPAVIIITSQAKKVLF